MFDFLNSMDVKEVVSIATLAFNGITTFIMLRVDNKITLLKVWCLENFERLKG